MIQEQQSPQPTPQQQPQSQQQPPSSTPIKPQQAPDGSFIPQYSSNAAQARTSSSFTEPSSNLISSSSQTPNNSLVAMSSSGSNQALTSSSQSSSSAERQTSSIVPSGDKECFVDITAYLNLPQTVAAKKLGMPTSTLSKRWREAVRNRKWPYRVVNKLDKEITTLLHNIPQGPGAPPIPEDVQEALAFLLRKRQEELRPVVIRV